MLHSCAPLTPWQPCPLPPQVFYLAAVLAATTLIALACSEAARRRHPVNLALLFSFTLAEGVLVGVAAASYESRAVVLAVGLTALVMLVLLAYAWQEREDFTAAGQCEGVRVCGVCG